MQLLLSLKFDILIFAPRQRVRECMFAPATYGQWTSAFCEGSRFEGGWNSGDAIEFLAPSGDGMFALIEDAKPFESIAIKLLGEVVNGEHRAAAWAPAYERYRFTEEGESTRLSVSAETAPDYEAYMRKTWPLALTRLRELCEAAA